MITKTFIWLVLPLTLYGCATALPTPPVVYNTAVEEVIQATVHRATLTDKLRVATYQGYRVSARRMRQTAPGCWIVQKRVHHYDRVEEASDIEVCQPY
ncbi:MAG: hypothetical protein ONB06_03005 [candidate division KSB1 bacterium]|nr:hypothetical protein [candidate division KSB1 bacterium]